MRIERYWNDGPVDAAPRLDWSRTRIVLTAAEGKENKDIALELKILAAPSLADATGSPNWVSRPSRKTRGDRATPKARDDLVRRISPPMLPTGALARRNQSLADQPRLACQQG